MPPRPRYTVHQNTATGARLVYDNVRNHPTHEGLTAWGASDIARTQETTWRRRCAHHQKAEHREGDSTR